MRVTLTSLGTGYRDTDFQYILECEENKYLFNVRDGTQRLCIEHSIRLSKLKTIFITRLSPETLGGLPGMLLSIYDMGVRELSIYGPEGLGDYISTLQLFMIRSDYSLHIVEIESDTEIIDLKNGVIIRSYVLYPHHNETKFCRKQHHTHDYVNLFISTIDRVDPIMGVEIAYIIDIPEIKGKFLPQKAKELGVPVGSLFRQLSEGHDVVVDGVVVTPAMVTEPPQRGPTVLLMSVHQKAVLENLLNSSLLLYLNGDCGIEKKPTLLAVYHNVPHSLRTTTLYQQFLTLFLSCVHHIILPDSLEYFYTPHTASQAACVRSHSLFPSLFPSQPSTVLSAAQSVTELPLTSIQEYLSTMQLTPLKGAGTMTRPKLDSVVLPLSTIEEEGIKLFAEITKTVPKTGIPGSLLFLGTGSAVPSKYRNVSATLFDVNDTVSILLDCGEGTVNQLLRLYPTTIRDVMRRIRVIFISHSHADHHLGLPLLLQTLSDMCTDDVTDRRSTHSWNMPDKRLKYDEQNPVVIVGPARVRVFLDMYSSHCPSLLHTYQYVTVSLPAQQVIYQPKDLTSPLCTACLLDTVESTVDGVITEIDGNNALIVRFPRWSLTFSLFPMVHTDDSTAVLIQSPCVSLLFTGDGRPARNVATYLPTLSVRFDLITHKQCVDVLLNECTFNSDRQEHAEIKKHCTMREAIEVARTVHARYTALTHFSQRYPKNLSHEQSGRNGSSKEEPDETEIPYENFFFSHDLMRVQLNDLDVLCRMREVFESCFVDEDDE